MLMLGFKTVSAQDFHRQIQEKRMYRGNIKVHVSLCQSTDWLSGLELQRVSVPCVNLTHVALHPGTCLATKP